MSNKKRKSKPSSGKFVALKNELFSTSNYKKTISKFKNNYDLSFIEKNFDYLYKFKFTHRYITDIPFPTNYSDIKKGILLNYSDFETELGWTSVVLSKFANEITNFLVLKNEFMQNMFLGKLSICEEKLNVIEQNYGFSLWSLENRLILYEEYYGLKRQKGYSSIITKDDTVDNLLKFIIYYVSIKVEKNISAEKYNSYINESLESMGPGMLVDYLRFRLLHQDLSSTRNLLGILLYESDSPIIDRYLTFIRICQLIFTTENEYKDTAKKSIEILHRAGLDDYNLTTLYNLSNEIISNGSEKYFSVGERFLELVNFYTAGDYKKCIEYGQVLALQNSNFIEIAELLLKSEIRNPTGFLSNFPECLYKNILIRMNDILLKTERTVSSFIQLTKIIIIYSSYSWTFQLMAFLTNEFLENEDTHKNFHMKFGLINGLPYNPKFEKLFDSALVKKKIIKELEALFRNNIVLDFFNAVIDENITLINSDKFTTIPQYRINKYCGFIYRNKGDYSHALEYYLDISVQNDLLSYLGSIWKIIECYLKCNSFEYAIDYIVESYLKNQQIYVKLPIRSIIEKIDLHKSSNLKSNLSLPILYDIYTKHFKSASGKEIEEYEAYEEYLISKDVEKPSQFVIENLDEVEYRKLIYFLRFICVQNIMDNSPHFMSSEDVDNERILICQILSRSDESNIDLYQDEIKEITQKLMINKGLREIEQSKIYVDIRGIKNLLENSIKESYDRFQALMDLDNDVLQDDFIVVNLGEKYSNLNIMLLGSGEKRKLLTSILLEIRDKFVSSNEYGLDTYISTGIRHGTLAGQLRAILELHNLITQKNTEGLYKENEYWLDKILYYESRKKRTLNNALSDFSKNIDELIDLLKSSYLQIKTETKNPSGLFNYTIDEIDVSMIQFKINRELSFNDFVELVIELLWEKTERSLNSIRKMFKDSLFEKFNNIFEKLIQDVTNISLKSELNNHIISARTEIQNELVKLASWFTRAKSTQSSDYKIDLPINIALEMVKNIYPKKNIELDKKIDASVELKGHSLSGLVNIYFMLFDNVVKHDGFTGIFSKVLLNVEFKGNELLIYIENSMNNLNDIFERRKKLNNIKKSLDGNNSIEKVKEEGGSGFYKILRILKVDLGVVANVEFDYKNDNCFFVKIVANFEGLII